MTEFTVMKQESSLFVEVLYTMVLESVLSSEATAPAALVAAAMLKQLVENHNIRAATRLWGLG